MSLKVDMWKDWILGGLFDANVLHNKINQTMNLIQK